MAATLDGLVNKFDLRGQMLGEVALGAVIKHSRDWNLARESVIESGLSIRTPAVDLQRACGTSVEAAIMIANKIALGQIECGIAGGTDTVSDAPIVYPDPYRRMLLDMHAARSPLSRVKSLFRFRPSFLKPELPGVEEPRTGLTMGASTEITAKEWNIQREHQDQLALSSHMKAAAAYDEGWYEDLVIPFQDVEEDNNIRRDTTFEKLSSLKPVFDHRKTGRARKTCPSSRISRSSGLRPSTSSMTRAC
jgi:acetyl-CoA C-acetyltransferase